MATLDWFIFVLFFFGLAGIVIWVLKNKKEDTSDYFLAGRDAGWIAVGASIFAANIGSEHLVGLAGAGAQSGMAMAHWEMQGWMILILGWLFVPFYEHSKVFTMPEFLEKRFNSGSRSFLSVITLISYVLTKVSVTAFTGGIFLKTVLGIDSMWGVDFFWIAAVGLVLLTGVFTVLGGMKGIMKISVVQTPILIVGSIIILILGLNKVGGWDEVMKACGNNIHLMRPATDPKFPWTGVILGAAIIGFWYWCTDQHIVQRVLSARNQTQARKGTIFAAYLKVLPVFMFLIPGMIAFALKKKGLLNMPDPNEAFPLLVSTLLPVGIKGIVIVGFLCALMSSLAAHFNSSATLFTIDFFKIYHPEASEKKLVVVGRLATGAVVLLGLVWIPIMRSLGAVLYEYLQNVQSLIAPAIAAVFLMGVFNKKITPKAGHWALIAGFCIGMFRLLLMIFKGQFSETSLFGQFLAVNWLHFCIFLFFFCIVLMVVVSYFTPKPTAEQLVGLTYTSTTEEQKASTRKSWNKWDVIHSLVVIGIIVIFYIYFW
ncbi:MAG: sodium:solute symporter [Bacteroidota bacterium]|nr:sodium:solute symporter [Bacteroidota bacterium]